jgi:hypothetical protein
VEAEGHAPLAVAERFGILPVAVARHRRPHRRGQLDVADLHGRAEHGRQEEGA